MDQKQIIIYNFTEQNTRNAQRTTVTEVFVC